VTRFHSTFQLRIALLLLAAAGVSSVQAWLHVTFPGERQRLPAVTQTYVSGAVTPGRTEQLYVNGVTTDVHRTGAFVTMVPVHPGTNTLTVFRGQERLVRRFVVEEAKPSPEPIASVATDDDPRLGPRTAWRTEGTLFANRVRSAPNAGETLFYLPRHFLISGSRLDGTEWVAVWAEGRRGFLPISVLSPAPGEAVPSADIMVPDPAAGFSETPPYGKPPSAVRICLDPGHGGSEPGALSPHGWREKEVNLMQARAIRAALEKAGFHVVMTRESDETVPLYDRPALACSEHVDAFISVHHNATPAHRDPREVRHTVAYASTSNGLALAACIQRHIAPVLKPVRNAGAQKRSFAVCRNPAVPSCLLEIDFINHPDGEAESWDPVRQQKVATAVVLGILDWMQPPQPLPVHEPASVRAPQTP
jgi:N-acetylmuramoyl-L-alanine amidase